MSFRDKDAEQPVFGAKPEPAEVVVASPEAMYVYAGRLEDGTRVVRDSDGLLHALAAVRRGGQEAAVQVQLCCRGSPSPGSQTARAGL